MQPSSSMAIVGDHEVEASRKGLRFEAHVNRSLQMTRVRSLPRHARQPRCNAVKYTLRAVVFLEAEEEADGVVLRVRDSGPGISAKKQQELFEHAQPGSVEGAGIGLRSHSTLRRRRVDPSRFRASSAKAPSCRCAFPERLPPEKARNTMPALWLLRGSSRTRYSRPLRIGPRRRPPGARRARHGRPRSRCRAPCA